MNTTNDERYSLILQAVARGWCSPENAPKVMDCDLAEAITREVLAALSPPAVEGFVLVPREAVQSAIKRLRLGVEGPQTADLLQDYLNEPALTPAGNGDDIEAMAERLAKYIYQQEARKCSTLDAYTHHMKGWPRALPEARAMLAAALAPAAVEGGDDPILAYFDTCAPKVDPPAAGDDYNWDAAHEALESMDDYARMSVGVAPTGPYAVLRDLLTRAKAWQRAAREAGRG